MARFTDKIAVVTGSSKAIGAGIAKRLMAEGAFVIANYGSSADDANRTATGGSIVNISSVVSRLAPASPGAPACNPFLLTVHQSPS